MLSSRTGISEAVLARKVRHGYIRTIDHHATHCIDGDEAARIEKLVRTLRSRSKGLEGLLVSQLHSRGRSGSEVVGWNINQLVAVARTLPPNERRILFDQVAWMCEGAGLRRLDETFERFVQNLTADPDARLIAGLLFELTAHLPASFARYINRLLLIASGRISTVHRLDHRVRTFAAEAGCDDKRAYYRFRVHIDDSLAKLLDCADLDSAARRVDVAAGQSAMTVNSSYDDDDCTPGAIILSFADRKPSVGII